MFNIIPTNEYTFNGYVFRYHPYLTPMHQDRIFELCGENVRIRDKWVAQVWVSLVEIVFPDEQQDVPGQYECNTGRS